MYRFITLIFLLPIIFFGFNLSVKAQSDEGIGLRPANIEEAMDPGQSKDFSVTVTNLSNQDQTYYLYKKDIVNASDSGVPIFADEKIAKTEFDVSEWMTLVIDTIDIKAHASLPFNFTIKVPDSATPGTHFAGVFVSMQPPKLRQSVASVGYEVANIISIRVAGEVEEKASIRQFSTDNYIYNKPEVIFNVKIENSGNTLLRPTGPLVVNNMFGKQVGMVIFNDKLAGVFPGITREFTTNWTGETPGFGRYEAIISPSFGEDGFKQTISSTVTFWILPMNIIAPAFGVLVFLLLITYVSARLYVRRKLAFYAATSGTRRLVKRRKQNGTSVVLLVLTTMFIVTALFIIVLLALFA